MSNGLLVISRKGNYRKEYPPSVPKTVITADEILLKMHRTLDTDSIAWMIISTARLKLATANLS